MATTVYMPADYSIALITMTAVILMAMDLRGFAGRIAIFLGLIFGYVVSWLADKVFGQITSVTPSWAARPSRTGASTGRRSRRPTGSASPSTPRTASWYRRSPPGTPTSAGTPSFSLAFILLVLPAVIALLAENVGHVKAVAGMTQTDLDPVMGRAVAADGVGTDDRLGRRRRSTTTYAENIGVMAATRVYSTAAYYVAATVAILLGLVPKFGQIVNATPPAVLGGITLVLYG